MRKSQFIILAKTGCVCMCHVGEQARLRPVCVSCNLVRVFVSEILQYGSKSKCTHSIVPLFEAFVYWDMGGSRGGTGDPDPPPLKNHKNIGFPSNTGPDTLKNHMATKPAFNIGPSSARQRNAI